MLLLPGVLIAALAWLGQAIPPLALASEAVTSFVTPALFIGLALFRLLKTLSPAELLQRDQKVWRQGLALGLLIGLVTFFSNGLFSYVSLGLVSSVVGPEGAHALFQAEQEGAARFVQESGFAPWFLFFLLAVLTPFAEELFFRGYVYSVLRHHWGLPAAMVGSALIFSAFHFYIIQALPIFVAGLLFAALYERTGSLLAPITAHATVNAIVVLLLFAQL